MSFENQMKSDEAQVEANMMRVKMKEVVDHEPTAEDYSKALRVVEEMKEAAANEPDADKAFLKIMQVGNKYFTKGIDTFVNLITFGKSANEEFLKNRLHMFDDAEARLNQLKDEAERLGRGEVK